MATSVAHAAVRPMTNERLRVAAVAVVGLIGWLGVIILAASLANATPSRVGFDLRLVLEAGARVASGQPVYDPRVMANAAQLRADDLFYSYPPVVAQVASFVSGTPVLLAAGVIGVCAALLAAFAGREIAATASGSAQEARIFVVVLATLPFVYPFAIAVLFGNLDAFYAAGFGLVLLAALRPSKQTTIVGGVALGLMSVAKIHPALLGFWLVVRGLHERRSGFAPWSWWTAVTAAATALVVVAASLIAFGPQAWADYVGLVGAIAGVRLQIPTNIGPAAQLGLLVGMSEASVRIVHLAVVAIALIATAIAGWRVRNAIASLATATVASLVVLPVTWFHYPAAVIPFGIAVAVTARARPLIAAAIGISILAIGVPVLLWIGMLLVLVGSARLPRGSRAPAAHS